MAPFVRGSQGMKMARLKEMAPFFGGEVKITRPHQLRLEKELTKSWDAPRIAGVIPGLSFSEFDARLTFFMCVSDVLLHILRVVPYLFTKKFRRGPDTQAPHHFHGWRIRVLFFPMEEVLWEGKMNETRS